MPYTDAQRREWQRWKSLSLEEKTQEIMRAHTCDWHAARRILAKRGAEARKRNAERLLQRDSVPWRGSRPVATPSPQPEPPRENDVANCRAGVGLAAADQNLPGL